MSRDKRVVLHVGAHKTGTTVIQQYLSAHLRGLERRGIRYVPRPALAPLVGWGELLVAEPDGFGAMLDSFRDTRRQRVLLASYENICGPPFGRGADGLYPKATAPIAALARLTAGYDTRILLTIRPVQELLESYYLQQVNMGARKPFATWLAGTDLDQLSWQPLVDTLRSAFEHVAVIDFAAIGRGPGHYVSEVLRRGGLDIPVDHSRTRALNPGPSERGMRMLLRGNEVLDRADDRAALRKFVQNNFSNVNGGRPTLLDAATRESVRARYATEYAELTAS